MSLLGQENGEHRKLCFGSGDYYVFCTDCMRTWVQIKLGSSDEPCADNLNNDVQGEERVKIDDTDI